MLSGPVMDAAYKSQSVTGDLKQQVHLEEVLCFWHNTERMLNLVFKQHRIIFLKEKGP